MTIQEQQFLIALLNLSKKLQANDMTVIDDIAIINSYTLSEDQIVQVCDIIRIECENAKAANKELLKTVANSLPFVDKTFLLELIEFTTLDLSNADAYKNYINSVITKPLSFMNSNNEFTFFSRMVSACIFAKDAALTAKVIDRLQAIPATTV